MAQMPRSRQSDEKNKQKMVTTVKNLNPRKGILGAMNYAVLVLSLLLIVWISYDTFTKVNFLENKKYMQFQLWVCIFFILDFFVELYYAEHKWYFLRKRLFFLLLSIPYLNIIAGLDIKMSADALYFVRFIPLARGALALSIVMGYVSSNAITSLFMSYIVILAAVAYFCSLIFFQREAPTNPDVKTYWSALWWTMMNLSTVGCYINPTTIAGKIIAVVLPICGMIMFPLFTVYLTDYVTRASKRSRFVQVLDKPSADDASSADEKNEGDGPNKNPS